MSSFRQINPPAVMLARFAYLMHLGAGLGGTILLVVALVRPSALSGLQAVLLFALAVSLRLLLRRCGRLRECSESFDGLFNPDAAPDPDDPDARLDRLLEERSAIEERRGTPAFDPWALLAVQHEIKEHLRSLPPQAPGRREPPHRDA